MGFVIIFLMLATAVAVIAIALRQLEALRASWQAVADELGLDAAMPRFGHAKIAGTTDDFTVSVEVTGSGDNAHTRYRVDFPPQTSAFMIRRESGGQRILKVFGIEDREIGDQAFDDAFVVQATNPSALKQWLDAGRRSSLLRLLASHPGLLATERHLEVSTKGVERSPDAIVTTVRRMLATARHLSGAKNAEELKEASRLRSKGDLLAALTALNAAVTADPEDVDTRLLRAETALSAGDNAQATEDLAVMESALGQDREIAGMRQVLERQAMSAGVAASLQTGDEVDPAPMFQTIFGEARLSFETDDLFAREYKGKRVTLTGAVRSTRPFDKDLDFGAGPRIKAVVTVASITSDLYGNTAIDAVVALPSDIRRRLERGDEITFTGVLSKVDPMMRNIFVEDGALTG